MGKKANLGASVTVDGEKEFKQALTQINNSLKVNASELTLLTIKYSDNAKSVEALTERQKVLGTAIENQQSKVNKLKEALSSASAKYGETDSKTLKWQVSLNKAQSELIGMNRDLEKTKTALKEANGELDKQSDKLEEATDKAKIAASSYSGVGDKMKAVFSLMQGQLTKIGNTISIVGASFVALGAAGSKSFLGFEDQFKKVTTLIDEKALSLNDARKGIIEISNDTGQSAAALADSMYDALSSNVSTADSLQFLYKSANLARAGFTDTKISVDILTTLMNSYGMSVKDVNKLSDQLILTQNLGKITVGQLGDSLGQVAGIAAQAKVPIADLFAAIAALTSNGVKPAEAITQIRSILSAVIKPTEEAREEAKKLGLQFNTTAIQTQGLAGFLANVQLKTKGNIDSFGKLFGNVEGLNASLILTGKGAATFTDALKQMQTASGQTDAAIAKLEENKAEQFSKDMNVLSNSLIQLGGALSPLTTGIANFATALSILPTPLLVIIPIIGTVLLIGGQILSLMANFKSVFGVLDAAGAAANVSMSAFGVKLLTIVGIVLAVVAAVTLLVLAINALTGRSDSFINSMRAASQITQQNSIDTSRYQREIGHNATGTNNWRGGLTWLHEKGGEIYDLPGGTRVYPHDISMEMIKSDNKASSGDTFNFHEGSIVIDAKNVQEFNSVIKTLKGVKPTKRAGTVIG